MVVKMKLKLWTSCLLIAIVIQNASAAHLSVNNDSNLHYINTRGKILCGTPAGNKILAQKDKNGIWQGMNAQLCQALSTAIFGRNDRFDMIPLEANQISDAFAQNKIDIMIGGLPFSATTDITTPALAADVWYYDQQTFIAHKKAEAKSMKAYRGQKVCVVNNSDDLNKLEAYNNRYQLDLSILRFPNFHSAKTAFLLNRCTLLTGDSILLRDIVVNSPAGVSDVDMIPENIAIRPIYAFTSKNNLNLNSIVKWTINALKEAEANELTSKNIDIHLTSSDPALRNLLGLNPQLWAHFNIQPNWLQIYLKENGNYGEVFENNLGQNSPFKLKRNENNLLKNNGLMLSMPFT